MQVTTFGIVIQEEPYDEFSKRLKILTSDKGVIYVNARGVLKPNALLKRCAQLYAYCRFTLHEKNGFYTLTEGELLTSFFHLSENIQCFATAAYLCEAAAAVVVPEFESGETLNLLLNSLYALKSGLFTPEFIKSVFEMRLAVISGFAPAVGNCEKCSKPLISCEEKYFFADEGLILCGECAQNTKSYSRPYRLSDAVYSAVEYLTRCSPKSIFSFKISEGALKEFSNISEKYLSAQLGKTFPSLEFLKSIGYNDYSDLPTEQY